MTVQVSAFDALCVWEEILENPYMYPGVENYRAVNGVCETRNRVIEMTRVISEACEAASAFGYAAPFDLKFVPMALKHGSNATNGDVSHLQMLPLYQKDPAMLGEYIAMLEITEHKQRLIIQALNELKVSTYTHWIPERINSMYNREVTK